MSITAFTAADIEKRSLQEMTDISLFTPGFNFENFGNEGGTAPVIRGATQVAGSIEQNVSFFMDGIYLPPRLRHRPRLRQHRTDRSGLRTAKCPLRPQCVHGGG